ncbi:hypothetical protein QW131_30765 [Roseibium salinum]|nr:hypothetical protein [Roseibium salinum]
MKKTFPHDLFRDAYRAWEAVKLQDEITSDPVRANLYQPARTDGRGVTRYDEAKAFPGYTLFHVRRRSGRPTRRHGWQRRP